VLESAPRPGGVILSEEYDGCTIDAGADALLIQKPAGIKLCEEIGLGDRLIAMKPPRLAFIQRNGQLHPLPAASVLGVPTRFGPFFRTRLFSWAGKIRMCAELFVQPRRDDTDESIGSFMTRRFGREATTYLAEPLLAGIHAGDVDRLSIRALFPQLAEAERRSGSVLRAFRHRAVAPSSPDGAFKSLPGGLSELVRALVKILPPDRVRLGARATRIAGHGSFSVITSDDHTVAGRAVVFATPAYVTGQLMGEQDGELARLCSSIPYVSSATVVLAFERHAVSHPLNGSGFVVPRVEGTGILAASWLSSKWPDRAPEGRVLLRTFAGGARDPGALDKSDAELVSTSLRALRPLLGISGEPRFTRVYRWDRANAQHEVGHLIRVQAIERTLERHPGIFVTGSGFRGVGIPDCVADGRSTAGRVVEYLNLKREKTP
jgi:oxygen-dependent protoporphyrinogen oxidase